MRIYHNIPALTAYNALNHTSNALQKTIQKLSTGLRINSASDDAAGLAISEKMRGQISGLEMAQRNAQDGISMLQTAEGAIQSTQSILQRMRELAVQASNDTLTAEDRSYIQLEVSELRSEIDRIANTTQFNGKRLLDGSSAGVVSSSNLNVKAYVRGSLREIDQFGQKKSFEGNYKIQIKASGVGEGQAQKSAIMVIKHPNVITDVQTNTKDGINTVRVDSVPAGDYKVKAAVAANAGAKVVGSYGFNTEVKPANLYVGSDWTKTGADFTSGTGEKIQLKLTKSDGSSHVSAAITLKGDFSTNSTAATINNIRDEIQKQINANEDIKGKISVDVNNGRLVFTSTDGTLSFGGTGGNAGITAATVETFNKAVEGYSETLTGGRITSSLESTTTIKLSLTDKDGEYISLKSTPPVELNGISISITKTAAGTNSATRAAAINAALKTATNASGAKVDLSGILSASVDPLGNVTLSSLVGHIDLNSTETADIREVLGAPTQVSLPHQTVEDYLNVTANTANNASILFEVTSIGSDTVTVKATSNVLTTDGTVKNYVRDNIILRTGNGTANAVNLGDLLGENETNFTLALGDGINSALFSSGNKFVYNVVGSGSGENMGDMSVTVEATQDPDWPNRWGDNWTDANGAVRGEWVSERLTYNLDSDAVANKELHFHNFYLNSENGTVYEGNVVLTTTDNFTLGGMQKPVTTTTASLNIASSKTGAAFTLNIGGTSAAVYTTTGTEANAADLAEHILANIHAKIADGTFTNISASRDGANITITSVDGKEITLACGSPTNYVVTGGTATASTPTAHQGNITTGDTLASFTAAYIGKTATGDTKLRDLSAFWDSQGVFMLESPQTITITQGDGKSTSITLYATDTLDDMRQKLNNAIGSGLGQAQYASGDTDKFCTFVQKKPGVDMPVNGLETVAGTFIFRSLIPGAAGCLTFSGNQDVLNAFSLNVVHEPKETSFTASIYDAHSGQAIATNVKVTDNNLIGILHPNVDIEFDPMANVTAVWSEPLSNFITQSKAEPYEAVIHLVDSSTVFQVGANKGEDLALDIGDMTAGSLGITKVNVATREAASRAIGQLDAAINKVSAQRAKIGAYQNSLEYTIENLQTTATNLTAAESRIRDADMAKTMMEFVKLQILNQSGTSMLAQANQLPQQVLSLLQ